MRRKANAKKNSSNLVEEKSKQPQGEIPGDSLKESLTIIGIILSIFIIFGHHHLHESFFE